MPPVDVIHVAGLATPPTKTIPLIISVDDLRPLRGEARTHLRIDQLRRAVERGAILVASSRSASHEVISVLGVAAQSVSSSCRPRYPASRRPRDGDDLVVNITGVDDLFVAIAPELIRLRDAQRGSRVVALASTEVGQRDSLERSRASTFARGADARAALANARVVMHLSDGARFPSFAIAALAAGVPTIARATEINRELLERRRGARRRRTTRSLDALDEVWSSESTPRHHGRRRTVASGRLRTRYGGAGVRRALSRRRARLVVVKRTIAISVEQLYRPQPGGIATYVRGLAAGLAALNDRSLDVDRRRAARRARRLAGDSDRRTLASA